MKHSSLLIVIALCSWFLNTHASANENKKSKLKYKYEGNNKIVKHNGIIFRADKSVADSAIVRSQKIIDAMLANDEYMRRQLTEMDFQINFTPSGGKITDVDNYAEFKGKKIKFKTSPSGSGNFEDQVAGLAEFHQLIVPEDDLGGTGQGRIMVHEFAHAIHFYMPKDEQRQISKAFENARRKRLYSPNLYINENSFEYWAESTAAWFNVQWRSRSGGINTRQALEAHDPEISKILKKIYGDSKFP